MTPTPAPLRAADLAPLRACDVAHGHDAEQINAEAVARRLNELLEIVQRLERSDEIGGWL